MKMRKNKLDTKEIKRLVREGRVHDFYDSTTWRKAACTARTIQHNECQVCKTQGFYSPCEVVHHMKPLKMYPSLALRQDNLQCLCRNCHEEIHGRVRTVGDTQLNIEKW